MSALPGSPRAARGRSGGADGAELRAAYALCERITREQARNFAWGIRLLPPPRRAALSAVYALARRVDDVGDGDLPLAAKREALAAVREALADPAAAGPADDPVVVAVLDAARRFPVPLASFGDLVDGVESDVEMDAGLRRTETVEELVLYCRRVAGSIGRLCLGVFARSDGDATGAGGGPDARAGQLADDLGVALQLTNILRDVREDLAGGRVYLPAEELERFGVELALAPDGSLAPDPGFAPLVRATAERARCWYAEGWQLLPLLDRRSRACTAAMAGIYRQLLDRIADDPDLVRTRRLALSGPAKAAVAVRALAVGR